MGPKKLGESSTNANHGLATDSRAASSVARGTSRSQATRRTGKSTVRNSSSKRPDTACSSVSSMSRMSGTSVATSKFSEFSVNTSRRTAGMPSNHEMVKKMECLEAQVDNERKVGSEITSPHLQNTFVVWIVFSWNHPMDWKMVLASN